MLNSIAIFFEFVKLFEEIFLCQKRLLKNLTIKVEWAKLTFENILTRPYDSEGIALKKENISDAVIRRLPRYYRQLTDLCRRGVVRISSHSLGQEMNITASQIRQDFSCFGEFGQQGYGYNVEELRSEIGHILGVDNDHHLIMIGVGNLGHALVLTIPQSVAQDTANRLMSLGVKGFWNFTNVELSSPYPDVKFENIHFADSLLTLSYRIANR